MPTPTSLKERKPSRTNGVPRAIGDVLHENVRVRPLAEAVSFDKARLAWSELHASALRIAAWLHAHGARKGDRVALALDNQLEFVQVMWACALGGFVLVPASPRLRADDLSFLLRHSGARLAFVPEQHEDFSFVGTIAGLPQTELKEIVAVPSPRSRAKAPKREGAYSFAEVARSRAAEYDVHVGADDVFGILYTSGATGNPKGAILTHHSVAWNGLAVGTALEADAQDVFLAAVPLSHTMGLVLTILAAAIAGARTVLAPLAASAADVLDLCEREGVTVHHGNPTMFLLELQAQAREPRDLSALRTGIIAAAPVDPGLVTRIRTEMHCNVQVGYGLTEAGPALTITRFSDPERKRTETAGRPIAGVEIKIDAGEGEVGEILARSPAMFRGYHAAARTTAEAFTADGWLRTGDTGSLDADGFLHVVGREKDVIIRSGLQIFPAEIEAMIGTLPWVRSVAVIGLPDRIFGERICACIGLAPDVAPPPNLLGAIRAALAGRIADFKLPDTAVAVDELPLTPNDKLQRHLLRDAVLKQLRKRGPEKVALSVRDPVIIDVPKPVWSRLAADFPAFDSDAGRAYYSLRATAARMNELVTEWLAPFGMTAKTMNLLTAMYANDTDRPLLVHEIGLASPMPGATLTATLDNLERKGLISRKHDKKDRRRIGIELTAKGRKFFERGFERFAEFLGEVFAPLTKSERETLLRILLKLNTGLDTLSE